MKKNELLKLFTQKMTIIEEEKFLIVTAGKKREEELFLQFDEKDEAVTVDNKQLLMYRSECHGKNLISPFFHRGVNIILVKGGKILVPKRAANKDLYPEMLDFSVGEHVKINEPYVEAAIRGCEEELGITIKEEELKYETKAKSSDKQNPEHAKFYILKADKEITISDELDSISYMKPEEVLQRIKEFTPHYRKVMAQLVESVLRK